MLKKSMFWLTVLCVILLAFTSCDNKNTKQDVKDNSGFTEDNAINDSTQPQPPDVTEEFVAPDIPGDLKFSGKKFTFLMNGNPYWEGRTDIYAEELNGDPINDAMFNRNKEIEEKFGIEIGESAVYGNNQTGTGPAYKQIEKNVNAGDNEYDAAIICGYEASTLAYNGFLQNLRKVPYMNLENVWWDQKANKTLAINDKIYMTTGDISWLVNDCSYAILFNKKLAADYELPNLYEIVKNNQWTIDKWAEIAKLVSVDLNGDGKMDENDLYGSIIWDDAIMGIVNSAGEKCATINSAGKIELTLGTPRVISALEKYLTASEDKASCFAYQRFAGIAGRDFFSNNQALFYVQLIEEVHYLRNMETDFGVIPFPKLDENQEGYPSSISPFPSIFFVIPASVENLEMSGAVVEQMAYLSRKYVKPAYYNITLKGKYARDEESEAMLDIIFSNRVFDLGWYYNLGNYTDGLMNLFRNYKKDFVSMYEKSEEKAINKLDKINEAYMSIE